MSCRDERLCHRIDAQSLTWSFQVAAIWSIKGTHSQLRHYFFFSMCTQSQQTKRVREVTAAAAAELECHFITNLPAFGHWRIKFPSFRTTVVCDLLAHTDGDGCWLSRCWRMVRWCFNVVTLLVLQHCSTNTTNVHHQNRLWHYQSPPHTLTLLFCLSFFATQLCQCVCVHISGHYFSLQLLYKQLLSFSFLVPSLFRTCTQQLMLAAAVDPAGYCDGGSVCTCATMASYCHRFCSAHLSMCCTACGVFSASLYIAVLCWFTSPSLSWS